MSANNPNETDCKYNLTYDSVDALVTSGEINVGASATAIVSSAGTITSLDITNAGSGYESATIKISAPPVIGVGIGSTATATATITNGTITSTSIVNPGLGYSNVTPPQVIIDLPSFKTEKIDQIFIHK